MRATNEVKLLESRQAARASATLARAFQDGPTMRDIALDEARRERLLPWYLGAAVRYCLPYGQVYTTEGVDGVACWLPPGETSMTSVGPALRSGMLFAPLKLGPPAFFRLLRLMSYMDRAHEVLAPEPHWYLVALGVEPSLKGKGIGSTLLEPVLARADAEGLSCYLETQDRANLAFYGKQGFEVVDEISPNGLQPIWSMKRSARDVGANTQGVMS